MILVDFETHCSRLSSILGDTQLVGDWEDVAEWLYISGAIKSVEVDTLQFNNSFGFCSAADDFDMTRENLLNKFVLAMSRFNFLWGGLEACLNTINPPKHPDKSKRGKISNACYFLNIYYSKNSYPPLLLLREEVETFRLAARECLGYEPVDTRFKLADDLGPGLGLFAVYKLRNLFSHGNLRFPYPYEDQPHSEHAKMITSATRVVLLSIQMLLLAHYQHPKIKVPYLYNFDLDRDEEILWIALSGCHLDTGVSEFQMRLF